MISVLIPYYNKMNSIERTIQSVKDYFSEFDYEIIIWDDGSNKKDFEFLLSLKSEYNRLIVLGPHKNKGRSFARNSLIKNAKGDWIFLLDADDYFISDIGIILKKIKNKSLDITSIYTFGYLKSDNKRKRFTEKIFYRAWHYDVLLFYCFGLYLPSCSSIVFSKVNKELVNFNVNIHQGEDLLAWLQLSRSVYFKHLFIPMVIYDQTGVENRYKYPEDAMNRIAKLGLRYKVYKWSMSQKFQKKDTLFNYTNSVKSILEKLLRILVIALSLQQLISIFIKNFAIIWLKKKE